MQMHLLTISLSFSSPGTTILLFNTTAPKVSSIMRIPNRLPTCLTSHKVIIQNMTFGGIQGFTRKPSTPWFDDDGEFAGIIHQERNLTYILINGAGHLASQWKPAQVNDVPLSHPSDQSIHSYLGARDGARIRSRQERDWIGDQQFDDWR